MCFLWNVSSYICHMICINRFDGGQLIVIFLNHDGYFLCINQSLPLPLHPQDETLWGYNP